MGVTDTQVRRFAALFKGYSRAYGQYSLRKEAEPGQKNVSTGKDIKTIQGPITKEVWLDHLNGTGPGLGVIMLQDNDTCRFGAIDVDDCNVNHELLYNKIHKLSLPLVVCRSKSGGAHLYVFTTEDIPGVIMRDRLDEWRAALGLSNKTEVFPKQVSRAGDETGNWINLPFQNAERTVRFAFKNADPLSLDLFLDWAEACRVDLARMRQPCYSSREEEDLFFEGPPCLVTLHGNGGFPDKTRNNGMFAIGIYLQKRYGDSWAEHMDRYNDVMGHQSSVEIAELIKNLKKKENRGNGADYTYPCKREPLNAVCQRRACLSREYGIGDAGTASARVEIMGVIRYDHPAPDPPIWSFEINTRRVKVDNDTFYSRDALNRACMAQAGCVPLHMPPAKWLKQLNELVQSAEVVPMPEDASPTGQLWERIEMFLQQGVNALSREEVLTGKVYRDDGKAFFRGVDLFTYLDARRVKYSSEQMVWQLLHAHEATKTVWSFGKKPNVTAANVWCMPYTAQIDPNTDGTSPSFQKMEEF